jgi:hypothetical protein
VVLVNLDEVPMPEPLAASGAGGCAGLLVGRRRDVLAPLAFRWMVGARAKPVLEIRDVKEGTRAAGDAPGPGGYLLYLLEATLRKFDAALKAGEEL